MLGATGEDRVPTRIANVRRAAAVWGARAIGGLAAGAALAALGLVAWLEAGTTGAPPHQVRDVTELVRIETERIVRPATVDALRRLIARHDGPISVGGGQFSMGGQIATEDTLFVDLRDLDEVVVLDVEGRTAKVEAGITWRALIEAIDPHDLSVEIMQSYANFTVGGSLSVNAHGRYVGEGPVAHSVRELELVLADGSLVRCSRAENAELFHAAVGGYGAIGVIATVTLDLARNTRLERRVERMPSADFVAWFDRTVRPDPRAVMFNADLYAPDYDALVAITFAETDDPVTEPDRLQPPGGSTAAQKAMFWWVSEAPGGKEARETVIDALRLASRPVVWRNHEATYDVASLDPGSRRWNTYILQEYFIPVDRFDAFVPRMAAVFQKHDVNVVNVSIRHARAEPDSLLTWAPVDVFAFVVYHKMGTGTEDWDHARVWTREMVDEVLRAGGRYYLPYQIHPTPEQFHASYPRAVELFELKRRVDPDYTFRNKLLDAYLPPTADYGGTFDPAPIRARLATRPTWRRQEDQTFLTLPEWSIVYAADETGAFLRTHRPSEFPWFGAIAQFWTSYRAVWGRTRASYDMNTGYHAMIGVIGVSFTVEYAAKGLWERTVGRVFERAGRVPEEDVYADIATDYGAFIHHTPWYAFPFAARRADLSAVDGPGLRGTERQIVTATELTLKSWWSAIIGAATGAAYDPEAETIELWTRGAPGDVAGIEGVEVVEVLAPGHLLLRAPRYEAFTAAARALADRGVEIVEVAGGARILVQVQADAGWTEAPLWGHVLTDWPLLSDPTRHRWALEIAVRRLDEVLPALTASGATVEHLYDF